MLGGDGLTQGMLYFMREARSHTNSCMPKFAGIFSAVVFFALGKKGKKGGGVAKIHEDTFATTKP